MFMLPHRQFNSVQLPLPFGCFSKCYLPGPPTPPTQHKTTQKALLPSERPMMVCFVQLLCCVWSRWPGVGDSVLVSDFFCGTCTHCTNGTIHIRIACLIYHFEKIYLIIHLIPFRTVVQDKATHFHGIC